jgi:hypothetical protein
MLAGYKVVGDGKDWVVEQWDSEKGYQDDSPFGSVWAAVRLAQMVADVANALDADTLPKFIEVVENL